MKVKEFIIETFDIPTATDEQWEEMIDLRQIIHHTNNPDDPAPNRELQRKSWEQYPDNPFMRPHFFSIRSSETDKLIGLYVYGYAKETHPQYEDQKHVAFADMFLLEDYRRRGYGTEILRELIQNLQAIGNITIAQCDTNIADGEKFAEAFGGSIAIRAVSNRLYAKDIDWAMLEDWYAETSDLATTNNVTMEHFEGLINEDDLEQYAKFYTEVMNQQPFEELEGVENTFTPDLMRQNEERLAKTGTIHVTKIAREADGTISGMTEFFYNPANPHKLEQGLTGVQQNYRGRKLGKWLKAAMMLHIRDTYPELQFINTTNANSNAPMLAINNKLGFKLYKQNTAYKFQLNELAAKVGL